MDILEKLISIDEKARQMHRDNDKQKEKLTHDIEDEKQRIYDKCMSDAKKQVEIKAEEIKTEAEKNFNKNEIRRKEALISLEEIYEANKKQWVDEIVKRVLT